MRALRALRTVWNFMVAIFLTFFWSTLGIVTWPLSPSGRLYLLYARTWSRMVFSLCGVKLVVKGRERIPWGRPYILMSNHMSYFDIFSLFAVAGQPVRMLAKKSIRSVPIFGWSMWMARFVFIDRSNYRQAYESIQLAARRIINGYTVAIFPEGTRSTDGRLGEFKPGGFMIAERARVPIVPIGIVGSDKVLPRGSVAIRPGIIEVRIGDPIPTEGLKRQELMEMVRASISGLLEGEGDGRYLSQDCPGK